MIQNPFLLLFFLLAVECVILRLNSRAETKFLFKFLPAVFWIFFIPMLASTFGWIYPKAPIYDQIIHLVLPVCLILLLIPVDLGAIWKLGRPSLLMMSAGALGVMAGTPLALFIFKNHLPADAWSGFGALAGSWIGGSSNMIAVKEAVRAREDLFAALVFVDVLVVYLWMGFLMTCSAHQHSLDRWNGSDRRVLSDLAQRIEKQKRDHPLRVTWKSIILVVGFALVFAQASGFAASFIPEIENGLSSFAWLIITASLIGLLLSLTPARRLESYGASKAGDFLILYVLTAIGAQADLTHMQNIGILILTACFILIIHILFLGAAWRMTKVPFFLLATASQANLGGVVSGPLMAEVYQPGFAAVGLLMAILGNVVGTYLGILVSYFNRVVMM